MDVVEMKDFPGVESLPSDLEHAVDMALLVDNSTKSTRLLDRLTRGASTL